MLLDEKLLDDNRHNEKLIDETAMAASRQREGVTKHPTKQRSKQRAKSG